MINPNDPNESSEARPVGVSGGNPEAVLLDLAEMVWGTFGDQSVTLV